MSTFTAEEQLTQESLRRVRTGNDVPHSGLYGLTGDDHPQYHTDARGDVRYAPIAKGVTNGDSHDHSGGDGAQIDHGGLGGLSDDDHTQYLKLAGRTEQTVAVPDNLNLGSSSNGTIIESTGFMKHTGSGRYWRDVDFPIIIRSTGTGIPTLATLNGNITAPQWQVNDYNICESQEFVHGWAEGSTCYWHLHLTTNGLDATNRYVRFTVEYGYVTPNGAWTFPATIDSGDILIPANTATKTMLIMSLGNFTPAGTTIGGHCIAVLKRIASSGTAPTNNPWVAMLQMHVLCDTEGSRNIGTK